MPHDAGCAVCGRPFNFPLTNPPETVRDFEVIEPINRGFYSAAFRVRQGPLGAEYVLKISSKAIYEKFAEHGKDFAEECRLHKDVADGSDHLVKITNMFDEDVRFGTDVIPCHVAVLEFVPGPTLDMFFGEHSELSARGVGQVALDLLQLLEELRAREVCHNDLHGGNIIVQALGPRSRRADALDGSIRAVAIDLGSVRDGSRSSANRSGDLRSIGEILELLSHKLLHSTNESDLDYRLAAQLQEISALLATDAVYQRPPEFPVLRDRIRYAHDLVASPWKEPPALKGMDDSYNAQTLHPWFIPRLLVDPEERWRREISISGPQVITGMRGCGKTMLVRALMFHARVAAKSDSGSDDDLAAALAEDGYVGLYVSCNRLLDTLGSTGPLHEPESRLFLAYVREALRALRHLRAVCPDQVPPGAGRQIGGVLADYVSGAQAGADTDDEQVLERLTLRMLASLQRRDTDYTLRSDPSAAFIALAEALRSTSPVWSNSQVFYLLDDVSTRHLQEQNIKDLVSRLIFSSDECAFKMTTEEQTLEYVLKSPGLVERAMPGRDYKVFQFGAAVSERIRASVAQGGGTAFVRSILELRAKQYPLHPDNVSPAELLGDETLEGIARRIVETPATAAERKSIYNGLRALTAVCVGDIGDVLAIYEDMLTKGGAETLPIPARVQHRAFLDNSAKRLLHLNLHREGKFKDVALGFADAAHELLVRTRRPSSSDRDSPRQYSSLYVRVTTDQSDEQFQQLRELIDAGVFVLDGGAPRTKAKDNDPVQQFVLKYRKLFGLGSYIGLADRDRFELSGDDLRTWLAEPKRGKEVLLRNLGQSVERAGGEEEPAADAAAFAPETPREPSRARAHTLFETEADEPSGDELNWFAARQAAAHSRTPVAQELMGDIGGQLGDVQSVVAALGFEERARSSAIALVEDADASRAMLIRYEMAGHAETILDVFRESAMDVDIVDARHGRAVVQRLPIGPVLIDVTGLSKALIFRSVRTALMRDKRVFVKHTQAVTHYPLQESVAAVLAAVDREDDWALTEALGSVVQGEEGPFEFEALLEPDADESRRRILIASASPKHHRLLSLVEAREPDEVHILAPSGSQPRDEVARWAADVAAKNARSSDVSELDSDDLGGALAKIADVHQLYYVDGNFNVELGLTGSKLHAVALAAFSAGARTSQAWYVRPASFDPEQFSLGTGPSRFFEIRTPL
jgi:serine/threonine protein kinase